MSVTGSKRGKGSHQQKKAKTPTGLLFAGKRGAAGGLLFTKTKPKPSFEHSATGGRR